MADLIKNIIERWVALYVRLSRDDENEGDSNSIAHQIEILTQYAKEHGITKYKIYKDDGFSGTNFNRPGFQEMLADIEACMVSMVIVKDMSRFGRDYIMVGYYTEIMLPQMDIRFIAVNDNVDSENQADNDFTPFRNIINEWYAKDTSKKIRAVFRSWDNPRAIYYRRMNDIPGDWGTAVNVQMMVFGNMGDTSGTGVAFSRNPSTGEKGLYGEYLMNAQGEDVVAGVRTPQPIDMLKKDNPAVYEQFKNIVEKLEKHYRDMQDMEFTIEEGKLFMLQTRNGKRTAAAAIKIACDLVDEGMIDEKEAVLMIDPKQLDALLHPQFDAAALKKATPLARALPASPGAACGKVVFTAEDATKWATEKKEKVVLVRLETSPEDIEGMHYAQGILTVRGGMTSHAAVVARGMGTCCVSGCGEIRIDEENKTFTLGGKTFVEGDYISLDGSTGNIYGEAIKTVAATVSGDFGRIMAWADKYRRLKVRANADTPKDAKKAREFGALVVPPLG